VFFPPSLQGKIGLQEVFEDRKVSGVDILLQMEERIQGVLYDSARSNSSPLGKSFLPLRPRSAVDNGVDP
jgi:hypothetical protein